MWSMKFTVVATYIWSMTYSCCHAHLVPDVQLLPCTSGPRCTFVEMHIWSQTHSCCHAHLVSDSRLLPCTSGLRLSCCYAHLVPDLQLLPCTSGPRLTVVTMHIWSQTHSCCHTHLVPDLQVLPCTYACSLRLRDIVLNDPVPAHVFLDLQWGQYLCTLWSMIVLFPFMRKTI